MKNKNVLSILLTLAMLLSLTLCAGASAFAAESDVKPMQQLKLIESKIDSLRQDDSQRTWYYTVTDLDHDGCLEFVAASLHPADRSTNLKVWSVSRDGTTLNEYRLNKDEEESFPDIMTDMADTYHVRDNDTWYYMVNDNVVLSDSEVYTVKTAVNLKDGSVGYNSYAVEHTVLTNGVRNVSHMDTSGFPISPEQYNAAGVNAFTDADKSNTAFEWLTADKIGNLDRLTESYEVFMGTREPTETFPVPKPAALGGENKPTPSPAPVPQPTPSSPAWLTITKNPTNENRTVGGNAIFVACANAYESLSWTFVSPDGGEYTPINFLSGSNATISGENSTTITVSKLESWMNGWGAYCTFYYKGQTARTTTAYMYVSAPAPTPTPQPGYGSMRGVAHEGGGGYAINLENGTEVFVDSWNCKVEGQFYDGCSAVVYYKDYPSNKNIYRADIFGNQGLIIPVEPTYGSMSGTAHEGGGGYAINLQNGTEVFVDSWNCNVEGQFYDGCSAVVYYTDYPSTANVYRADIFGNMGLIVPDEDKGGWAGSNYYENEHYFADEDQGGWAGSNYYDNEPDYADEDQGGWAGSNYYDNEPDYADEDQGGWAGSNYYDNEPDYADEDQGGWAGSNYYDNEPDYFDDSLYDPVGDEYNRVTCPLCGNHFSVGLDECPVCGWTP